MEVGGHRLKSITLSSMKSLLTLADREKQSGHSQNTGSQETNLRIRRESMMWITPL